MRQAKFTIKVFLKGKHLSKVYNKNTRTTSLGTHSAAFLSNFEGNILTGKYLLIVKKIGIIRYEKFTQIKNKKSRTTEFVSYVSVLIVAFSTASLVSALIEKFLNRYLTFAILLTFFYCFYSCY